MGKRPQLCPKCRRLVGVSDRVCHQCGAGLGIQRRLLGKMGRASVQGAEAMPWWKIVLFFNLALYGVGLLVTARSGVSVMGSGMNLLAPSSEVQLQLGLQTSALVYNGAVWRLITCLFLHANLMHLGFNMYFLAQLGPAAERVFGNRGFLIVYLLGGVCGSLIELVIGNSVLGASGSIMALIGALAGLGYLRAGTWRNEMTREMVRVLAFVTIFGLLLGSVAHGAHIGGFVGGCLILLLLRALQKKRWQRLLDGIGYATAALVIASFVMMGAGLRHPSIGQLQAYERCIEEARREVKKVVESDFKGGEVPVCLTALSGSLGAEADAVLQGLADLLSHPGKPGWAEQYIAILKAHNLWISSEAKRLGLLP